MLLSTLCTPYSLSSTALTFDRLSMLIRHRRISLPASNTVFRLTSAEPPFLGQPVIDTQEFTVLNPLATLPPQSLTAPDGRNTLRSGHYLKASA